MAIDQTVFSEIKAYLNITWEDAATDTKVTGIIEDGMAYLDDKAGGAQNYANPGKARSLLKDYCRYARDGALDVFETNYLSLIMAMRDETVVMIDEPQEAAGAAG